MSTKRLLSLLCVVVAVTIARTIAADPPAPEQKAASKQEAALTQDQASKQLEALLKERRDTLRQMVENLEVGQRSGTGITELSVLHARNELLDAELDLAKTREERVAVREKMVANLKVIEKAAEMQYRMGTTTPETLLRAKAARLKAEAQLLREKTGDGK
jgi:hypothetical protein